MTTSPVRSSSARSVLFIGGTGIISSASVALAVEKGWDVTVLNRGASSLRPLPAAVERVTADARDADSVRAALGERTFDVVCDFVAFTTDHVERDIELFTGRTRQYVFISSASAYQKPPTSLPVRESTILRNPYWQYSRDKIACEETLIDAWRTAGFPITIVRPSHTYDQVSIPLDAGWTGLRRLVEGREVVVHGDGTSLWTLTHTTDFAKAFVGLLGQPAAIGQVYHITSDEWLSWDAICTELAHAAGQEPKLVHVPSDILAREVPAWGPGLLGDKAHSMLFDNSAVKALVPEFICTTPFAAGARQIVAYYLAHPERQQVDSDLDATLDRLVREFGRR